MLEKKKIGGWLVTLLMAWAPASVAAAQQAAADSDEQYRARQQRVLLHLAEQFDGDRDFGERDMVRFGFEMMRLLANLEVWDRGIGEGICPAQADAILQKRVPQCIEMLGTPDDPGPWSWQRSGSPAIKHAALAFGMMVHRWGDELSDQVIEQIRHAVEETTWRDDPSQYLVNGRLSVHAARLLVGEYLGYDSSLWQTGTADFRRMYRRTMSYGGLEMNSPIYTVYHWPPLVMLQDLKDESMRNKARILLDYQLIVAGHLFLPGGGLGAPQARDRSGGIRQRGTLPQMYWLLFGDVAAPAGNTLHHVMAVGRNYRPPQIIRSLFVDKPKSGYEFWTYTDHPVAGPKPHSQYDLGPAGTATTVGPWQAVMMPDGKVPMRINYGYRFQSIHVSMGVYAKDDPFTGP